MVRKYDEYNKATDEAKEIISKSKVKPMEKESLPQLHIVDRLPTKEVRQIDEDGQRHDFITTREAVVELWNAVMEQKK